MRTLQVSSITPLFGLPPSSPAITSFLTSLSATFSLPKPDIKSYTDAVFYNYYELGISMCFLPGKDLESIDFFNVDSKPSPERSGKRTPSYKASPQILVQFTSTTLVLPPNPKNKNEVPRSVSRPPSLRFAPTTIGRELVSSLGEPSRKGSGSWTGLWLEWNKVVFKMNQNEESVIGIMVELRDPGAGEVTEDTIKNGLGGIWERAAKWEWKSLKLFKPE
ncbi:hypothetical protein L204_102409 [Cryptococcus depauperatus]|nr:hypothetical protein L204_05889 [Cryptococcus depauperatus CBS 7855]